jgi:type II secretory pathway pseudopilin PulG
MGNEALAYLRRMRRRLRLSSEDGSLLIEVMIGAVLVVSVSAAVLDGLSGARDTGNRNRARSVSASLAQQDQERLRAKPVAQLSNYQETRTVNLQNITYTVKSEADWVRDASGVVSCTNDSTAAQYLKITSTVNSAINSKAPVRQTSLVSPPRGTFDANQGTVAVQVVDREQKPLQGVRVDLLGPSSYSDTTNDLGCVVFGYIQEGPWTAKVSSLGLIGTDGKSPFQTTITNVAGTTVVKQILLDKPAAVTAQFDTVPFGLSTPVPVPKGVAWTSMSLSNASLPSPFFRTFTVNPAANSILADKVFPFLDGYGVYAGDCDVNNPTNDPTNLDTYFTTSPGSAAFANPAPAGSASVVARLPSINIEVQDQNGVAQAGARMFVKSADADCSTPAWSSATPAPWKQTSGDGINPLPPAIPILKGWMPTPYFPFGPYTVCADNNASGTAKRYTGKITINNTNPNGTGNGTTKTPIKYLNGSFSTNQKLCTDP